MTRGVLAVGDQVRFEERTWTVAALQGVRARLVDEAGGIAVLLLPHLFADPRFEVIGGVPRGHVPPFGLLDTLPEQMREQVMAWERHVREVETGLPDPGEGTPRAEYDPAVRSLAEREAAKAAELTAGGQRTSVATVRRMRARYRDNGVWGLVDQRLTRGKSPLGRADPRAVDAILTTLKEQRDRSTGTLTRLRKQVQWRLDDQHGTDAVKAPPQSTFNRLVHALADGQGLLGTAAQRRRSASRPAPPFTPTVALRPGELVMMDSTPLDVMAVLDDGVLGRPELTIAFDVATRSICAAVLRPPGTKTVDAAVLLAQMVTPMPMHPGWDEALAMRRSVIPYERLVSLDERLEEAAARPVIMPETVVVDQGKVFVSAAFLGACGSLGVSVQPVPPANGPAKGHVERNFGGINAGFCQYVAGYTGSDTTERGSTVEDEARWSLPQLQEFFDEWLITGWHHRKHSSLRHPLMPKLALSPNEMWAALVGVAGHVPVPLAADDYVELLPVKWLAINDYGIRFDYRTYDDKALNEQRGRRSTIAAQKGRWEVHHNPYDPNRIWVRLPDGFVEVPWIHTTQVSMPFTDFTWQHIRKTVRRRTGDRDAHELELAQALDDLLRRAHGGKATRRERSVAARANAAASMAAGPPAPAARLDVLSAPSVSFGLNGIYAPERAFDDDLPDQDDTDFLSALESDTDGEDDQVPPPRRSRRSSILNDAHQESDLWL